ncbi:hypothetical protein [Streptoalloteichus hindustanus]|uniref:hypothetical protein n=1 Tax=Streptoalloteichus hindustanus TaxID=2017 RepID=UPI000936CB15|nr:hypothetical protein [Streptoalloteichus hindustanus]
MRPNVRILLVVTCAAVVLPTAGAVLLHSARATGGPPVRHGEVAVLVASAADTGFRLRTTETLRVGAPRTQQVVPAGTVITAPPAALPGNPPVDARLGCEVTVTPTSGELPTVEVRRCRPANAS